MSTFDRFSLIIQVDMPGIKKEDINLELNAEKSLLTLSAERHGTAKKETETYRAMERYRGHFSRSISLPRNVNTESINAEYANGVLHVTLPKLKAEMEECTAKKIAIK
jgi:HSP20 family protein